MDAITHNEVKMRQAAPDIARANNLTNLFVIDGLKEQIGRLSDALAQRRGQCCGKCSTCRSDDALLAEIKARG